MNNQDPMPDRAGIRLVMGFSNTDQLVSTNANILRIVNIAERSCTRFEFGSESLYPNFPAKNFEVDKSAE